MLKKALSNKNDCDEAYTALLLRYSPSQEGDLDSSCHDPRRPNTLMNKHARKLAPMMNSATKSSLMVAEIYSLRFKFQQSLAHFL